MAGVGGALVIALVAVLVVFLLIWIAASRYRKVGPNEAFIVYGRAAARHQGRRHADRLADDPQLPRRCRWS